MREDENGAGSKSEEGEELFDLLLPDGLPMDIIGEALDRFDVRPSCVDGDESKPTLRGSFEEVTKAKDYMFARLKEFIAEEERKSLK
ncbi:MAG: hypothetical protein ACXQS6_05360 [Candidatus Syntropharchaeales archaeon]|nr:hypothetical protein [Candidatus Syntrophoarchaeum sp.]